MYYMPHVGNSAIGAIQEAMNRYTQKTCIQFIERTNEEDYIRFYRGNGLAQPDSPYHTL